VAKGCETQTFPKPLNGMTCVPTVLTRVQQSGSVRYRRHQWIDRVAPGEAKGKSPEPDEQAKGNKQTMKKLMIVAAAAAISAGATAAELDAQVYDVNLTVKSTTCKEVKVSKTIATLWGEDYADVKGETVATRKQASTKIAGVIWGCECETIADPAWRLYNGGKTIGGYLFWNVGGENAFNIFTTTFAWAVFNRIDNGDKVEGAWVLLNRDADNTLAFLGAGFGKVKGTDCRLTLTSMNGNFAGFILAGSDAGGCAFCGSVGCEAWAVCPCTTVAYDTDLTVAYGTWKIKYNKSASQKLRKTGKITSSYNFKKAGDAATIMAKVENAAAKGTLTAGDYWDDGDPALSFEFGEKIEAADVGAVAYETEAGAADGEAPDEYEGESGIVEALLAIAEAGEEADAS
jgi:hypothetical protein